MIGMTGISGKLGISDIIIPRWYKSFPGLIVISMTCVDMDFVQTL